MTNINYNIGDIVKVKSRFGTAIPDVHVKLVEKHKRKCYDTNKLYYMWKTKLIYKREVEILKKRFCIPFKYPNNVETFIYEEDIICRLN